MSSQQAATQVEFADIITPIGGLWLALRAGKLCAVKFADGGQHISEVVRRRFGSCVSVRRPAADNQAVCALRAYFAGDLEAPRNLPVDAGGTAFQQRVWEELRRIPPGTTASYSELAARIGNANAVRAVARANASNPIAIVVPCHRVIGADGDLRGYGGGIERKAWLLRLEGARSWR